jgi:hypothetical protein
MIFIPETSFNLEPLIYHSTDIAHGKVIAQQIFSDLLESVVNHI